MISFEFFTLLILIFSTVPNLGFFTFPAITTLTIGIGAIVINIILKSRKDYVDKKIVAHIESLPAIAILIFSAMYYGGLYQYQVGVVLGIAIFMLLNLWLLLQEFFFKGNTFTIKLIIGVYIVLSLLTLFTSPHPKVDTFTLFKEAPLELLKGHNPYIKEYTQVYSGIVNNFPYLPFSLYITLPALVFFGDPRITIVLANLVSLYFLNKLFIKKKLTVNKEYYIALLLLFPRSFFVMEHMYLDPIIFCFFVMFAYFYATKKDRISFFCLSLLFLFKIHIVVLMAPILLMDRGFRERIKVKENLLSFIVPFILPIYYLLESPIKFINTFIHLIPNNAITYIGPTKMSLSFVNLINKIPIFDNPNAYLYGVACFLLAYIIILKLNIPIYLKIASVFILFQYFTYMSYFNNYYYTMMLWLFYIYSEDGDKIRLLKKK